MCTDNFMLPTVSVIPCFHFNRVSGKSQKQYDPKNYPLQLTLIFSKHQNGLKSYLKHHLDQQSKGDMRYRMVGKYMNEVQIFGNNIDAYRDVLNALGHTQIELWKRGGIDKKIYPCDLYQEGKSIYNRYLEYASQP